VDKASQLGIIALVPDDWDGIVTLRHQVLRRLAQYYQVVWVEPALNWREFLKPSGSHFLASDRWSEPSPSMEVLATGTDAETLRQHLPGADITPTPRGLRIEISSEDEIEGVLSALRKAGGKIVSVQPVKQSLEELFLD